MTMQHYDLVLFDLDGTLVDSVPDLTTALGLMLAERGLPPHNEQTVRQIIGEGQRSLVERALLLASPALAGEPELDPVLLDEAVLRFREHYSANLCQKTRRYDGVLETLQTLAARKPLAVATNKPGRWARALCDELALSPMLRWVLGEDDVGARKPDPTILLELCRRAAVSTEKTLFVGDSRIDWKAAQAAGIDLALCTYGYADEATLRTAERLASDPSLRLGCPERPYVLHSLVELLPIASQ